MNAQLQDSAIRHAIYLERFKGRQANKIVKHLNKEVFPDLLKKLSTRLERISARGFDTSVRRTKRLLQMVEGLDSIIDDGFRGTETILRADLKGLAAAEVRLQRLVMGQALPINVSFISPSAQLLDSVVTSRPFEGQILKGWFQDLGRTTKKNVQRQVQIGITSGESVPNIVRRLQGTRANRYADGILDTARHQTEAVVRTAINHTSTHAREETYKANSSFIKGVRIVATLDSRTTLICMGLDGKVFPPNEGRRPPFHFNCRTTTTPITKSWKELGINLKEAPPGTRASMGGQVPATQTYGTWLKRQDKSTQDVALGRERAKLFRSGKIKVEQFTTKHGRTLGLGELEKLEGASIRGKKASA